MVIAAQRCDQFLPQLQKIFFVVVVRGGGVATRGDKQLVIRHEVIEQQAHEACSLRDFFCFFGRAFQDETVQARRVRRKRSAETILVAPADAARFENGAQKFADLRMARGHFIFARPQRERAARGIERLGRDLRNDAVNDGAAGVAAGIGRAHKRAKRRRAMQVAALRRPTGGRAFQNFGL